MTTNRSYSESLFNIFKGVVFLDCEATGLDPSAEQLIELGIVTAQGNVRLSQFAKPSQPLSARITELTGISDQDLSDAPSEQALIELAHPILAAAEALGGYFLHLDYEYLRGAYTRAGLQDQFASISEKPLICAKTLARRILPEIPMDFSLADLCAHLHVSVKHCHRAADDAIMSQQVTVALAARSQAKTLEELLSFQGPVVRSPWELPNSTEEEKVGARQRWQQFVASSRA